MNSWQWLKLIHVLLSDCRKGRRLERREQEREEKIIDGRELEREEIGEKREHKKTAETTGGTTEEGRE